MIPLSILFVNKGDIGAGDFDGPPDDPDLKIKDVVVIDKGMANSGLPAVAIRIELPDGRVMVAQTSALLFVSAARAITGKYPELLV